MQDKINIGFDAKRAFLNRSGLGSYSRDTIRIMSSLKANNEYSLYTPGVPKDPIFNPPPRDKICLPTGLFYSTLPSVWRSFGIAGDLKRDKIQLFHGLSNELPFNLNKSGIPTVVTIHDLIFLTHPQYYKLIDRTIYKKKFSHSASIADAIIAVSKKTREDIVNLLGINRDKIFVVYQGCNPIFSRITSEKEKAEVRVKYGLPSEYLLCVGTIEERKNQLSILKAMRKGKIEIPLILIGKATPYSSRINMYIEKERIAHVKMLQNVATADLPAVYQMASVFVYPSLVEGFGIPVLEAILSKLPVITSRGGSMEEAGGPAALYVNPEDDDELAQGIRKCLEDSDLRARLLQEGANHSLHFTDYSIAENIMQVYNRLF